jgi:hypothetical protein
MATMIWPPTPQVPAPRQVDIPVDVGTDEAASNDSQNMLERLSQPRCSRS